MEGEIVRKIKREKEKEGDRGREVAAVVISCRNVYLPPVRVCVRVCAC